jgi:prolipoprotein diacylglyceryltransferase
VIFVCLNFLYWKKDGGKYPGLLAGFFFFFEFIFRIFIEFFKENQVPIEASLPLNIGQLLSIPVILLGAWMLLRARKLGPVSVSGL